MQHSKSLQHIKQGTTNKAKFSSQVKYHGLIGLLNDFLGLSRAATCISARPCSANFYCLAPNRYEGYLASKLKSHEQAKSCNHSEETEVVHWNPSIVDFFV